MRLLHCGTKEIKEFAQDVPPYAILSHTWDTEELSFALLSEKGPCDIVTCLKGWKKIEWACQQSIVDGYQYVWVDTVCIDKSSSVELSEAINSMYGYYCNAEVCYVYLSDVDADLITMLAADNEEPRDSTSTCSSGHTGLGDSRWFTRGWTLQELIAPLEMTFYDHDWKQLTTKKSALEELATITGIDEIFLAGGNLRLASTARILSWAARRQTTREEDQAYSLLGLFNISMPMLYGEGSAAFLRLQKMLIETYDDESIFAWNYPMCPSLKWDGILAPSPDVFYNSGNMVPRWWLLNQSSANTSQNIVSSISTPTTWTNRGLLFRECQSHDPLNSKIVKLGLIQLQCVDITRPSFVAQILVMFTDNTQRRCVRVRDSNIYHSEPLLESDLREVYAVASGIHNAGEKVVAYARSVHISRMPVWLQNRPYCRIYPEPLENEPDHDTEHTLYVFNHKFIIYRQVWPVTPNSHSDIEHIVPHIVFYLINNNRLQVNAVPFLKDYNMAQIEAVSFLNDCNMAQVDAVPFLKKFSQKFSIFNKKTDKRVASDDRLRIAVRSFQGYADVRKSIESVVRRKMDADLESGLSDFVTCEHEGLKVEACLHRSHLDAKHYGLSIFVTPLPFDMGAFWFGFDPSRSPNLPR